MISPHTNEQLRRVRAHHQGLDADSRLPSAAGVVRRLCALQAQEWSSAQLAIFSRAHGISRADVIHAREVQRAFVLTWSLRGTLHLAATEDIRWLLKICGPGAIRATRRRYQQLGLSESNRQDALAAMKSILGGGKALTRSELARELAGHGIPTEGQAIHHLVRFAALRGLICLGPEIDGALTYVLLDEWLPPGAQGEPPDEPLASFARRYLEAYAPAGAADFARWSGLSAAQLRQAWQLIAPECVTVAIPGGEAQMLKTQLKYIDDIQRECTVRFLPRYDNYLLGYKSRAFMVADAYAKRVHPGGGMIRTCVTVDGEARASWKLENRRKGVRVTVSPYDSLGASQIALLEGEAEALGRFLNAELEMRIAHD